MGKQIKKISTLVFYFLKERRVGLVAFLANHFLLMHLRFLVNHHSDNVLILLWKNRFRRSLPICRNQLHVLKVNVIEKCFTLTNFGGEEGGAVVFSLTVFILCNYCFIQYYFFFGKQIQKVSSHL